MRATAACAVLLGAFALTQNLSAQTPADASEGIPDLSGIWQTINTANWDLEEHGAAPSPFPKLLGAYFAQPPGPSVVEGGTIPYKPEGLAQRNKYRAGRLTTDPLDVENKDEDTADPEAKCFQGGVPRSTYMPFPFQIVQSQKYVLVVHEYANALRTIHMDDHKEAPAESWMGWSNGKWDGDTLVIEVTGFNGQTWFDRAGNFHSEALKVTERYTPMSPYHLQYEATIEDPKVFTRPWKIRMPLYRHMEQNAQRLEFKCVEFTEELIYGTLKKPGAK